MLFGIKRKNSEICGILPIFKFCTGFFRFFVKNPDFSVNLIFFDFFIKLELILKQKAKTERKKLFPVGFYGHLLFSEFCWRQQIYLRNRWRHQISGDVKVLILFPPILKPIFIMISLNYRELWVWNLSWLYIFWHIDKSWACPGDDVIKFLEKFFVQCKQK